MYPVNNVRKLSVIIQFQKEEIPAIEMQFEELVYLKLYPVNKEYTCEILNAGMLYKNDLFYWYDTVYGDFMWKRGFEL